MERTNERMTRRKGDWQMANDAADDSIDFRIQEPGVYYIIADAEGIWLTEMPDDDDEILFETTDLFTAEQVLCREISHCD
jgi:hypothetical protein